MNVLLQTIAFRTRFRDSRFHCWLQGGDDCPARDGENRQHALFGGGPCVAVHPSDIASALLALDATFVTQGGSGERHIPAGDFFRGFLETALAPDELLTEIRVPKSGPNGFAFEKFNRRAQDFATVGVVAARTNGATRVSLINMGSTPLRAYRR